MKKMQLPVIHLIGLSLGSKTTNKNGQSSVDCGKLWQKFETESLINKIDQRLSDEIFAVYYDYDRDHNSPFSYFIGCKVASQPKTPKNMQSLTIPGGSFVKKVAKGKMPDCIANEWKEIWSSNLKRAYEYDFEVYGNRSKNWNTGEVDIFVSVK